MVTATEILECLADSPAPVAEVSWTEAFYRGDTKTMAALYRAHFGTVRAAVGQILSGADGETVTHEVFFRLLSSESVRRAYRTGAFSSWIYTVARHHAVDYARRRARETPTGLVPANEGVAPGLPDQIEARSMVRRFRDQVLPAKWVSVFDARFVGQLDQRAAARSLGIPRTTLVYREHRIRTLLRAFLRSDEEP